MTRLTTFALLFASFALAPTLGRLNTAVGQQESPATAEQDDGKTEAAPKRAKPRGRLPVYYSRVVSQEQREEIYALQAKYQTQIAKLLLEVEKLEMQRDKEVREVLTDEQREKVDALVAEAKAKREARRKSSGSPSTDTP